MSNKVTHQSGKPVSLTADDFKLIRGIGPGVEQRLHSAGILSYARLAALSPADIAALTSDVAGLSTERIVKQDWIGQARQLAQGLPHPAEEAAESTVAKEVPTLPQEIVQETAQISFRLELNLDERRQLNRLRVIHEQSGTEESWESWEQRRLIDFLEKSAVTRLALSEVAVENEPDRPASGLTGIPKLTRLEAISPATGQPGRLVRAGQPFEVRLGVDLETVTFPETASLAYLIGIYAKPLTAGGQPQTQAELCGTVSEPGRFNLTATATGLKPGSYRLEATLILTAPGEQTVPHVDLMAMLEGSLIQVY